MFGTKEFSVLQTRQKRVGHSHSLDMLVSLLCTSVFLSLFHDLPPPAFSLSSSS